MTRHLCLAFLSASFSLPPLMAFEPKAEPVTSTISILDLVKNKAVEYHINPDVDEPDAPEQIFQIKGDELHISGHGFGYMATRQSFKDYRLIVEFKWTGKTSGKRKDRARDNGILVHGHGAHGAHTKTWMSSIEAQIIEGGMGDILVLSGKNEDGSPVATSLDCEFVLNPKGEKVWKKKAPRTTVTSGRVNWEKRHVDWKDQLNWRAKDDLDAPIGQWNRLEVVASGPDLQYFFNGQLVNEGFNAKPSEGRICIQTEGAEMIVRRYELQPLKSEQQ